MKPQVHVNAVGSNQAKKRELPAELIAQAALIAVDSNTKECRHLTNPDREGMLEDDS